MWPPSIRARRSRPEVTRHGSIDVQIGAVLPDGAKVASATLNGSPTKLKLVKTTRGLEAVTEGQARAAYGDTGDHRRSLDLDALTDLRVS
jgi:hypothetical protein